MADDVRSAVADLGNQRVHRPHAGQPRAEQVAIEQADPFGLVERRKDLIVTQSIAEMWSDAAAEIRRRPVDLEEARPLHHPGLVERHIGGVVRGGLFESNIEVMERQVVDLVFGPHHGVTEAERAVRKLERNFPVSDRKTLG